MDELMKREPVPDAPQSEDAYRSIRGYVIEAQAQVYTAVNTAMVTAYWKIGKPIFEACGETTVPLMASRCYNTFPSG